MILYYNIEHVADGEIRYNIFNWPYTYQVVYEKDSTIMSLRSLEEARKYATIEAERRAELLMDTLKGTR